VGAGNRAAKPPNPSLIEEREERTRGRQENSRRPGGSWETATPAPPRISACPRGHCPVRPHLLCATSASRRPRLLCASVRPRLLCASSFGRRPRLCANPLLICGLARPSRARACSPVSPPLCFAARACLLLVLALLYASRAWEERKDGRSNWEGKNVWYNSSKKVCICY
jgi:hypothetical protein